MCILSFVTMLTFERVVRGFKPFVPDLGDRFLDIRTFNPTDPTIHCLVSFKGHTTGEKYYPPGLWVYVDKPGDEMLLHNPELDLSLVEGLVGCLDMGNVYNAVTMGSLGFSYHPTK